MRFGASRPSAFLAWAVVALVSCRRIDEPGRPTLELGTYALESIDGRSLPTGAPCGGGQILEGSIVLEVPGTAAHTLRRTHRATGQEIAYSGAGTYRMTRGQLVLRLKGRWSHQDAFHHAQITLDIEPGFLSQRGVGAECDASSTQHYRWQPT